MSGKSRNSAQIFRVDARGVFMESMSDGFAIEKVKFNFSRYDLNRPQGQRQTAFISIYLDIAEFLEIHRRVASGELIWELRERKKANDQSPAFEKLSGTSAAELARQKRARPDGHAESRIFKFGAGRGQEVVFTATKGPGQETDKGLIAPLSGVKPEQWVQVPMSLNSFVQMVLITQAHFMAWLTSAYLSGVYSTVRQDDQLQRGPNTQEFAQYSEYERNLYPQSPDMSFRQDVSALW